MGWNSCQSRVFSILRSCNCEQMEAMWRVDWEAGGGSVSFAVRAMCVTALCLFYRQPIMQIHITWISHNKWVKQSSWPQLPGSCTIWSARLILWSNGRGGGGVKEVHRPPVWLRIHSHAHTHACTHAQAHKHTYTHSAWLIQVVTVTTGLPVTGATWVEA